MDLDGNTSREPELPRPTEAAPFPREELLRAFTSHGAYLSFEEKQKGSLEAGMLADLIVLSEDPLKVSTEDLRDIEVLLTVVGGKVVYNKREAFPTEI
jgi:hypothetical protein|tara:strand:+ start:104 stop:397 length:294 start_codon:yes stop_codon:yes gene_type:complete